MEREKENELTGEGWREGKRVSRRDVERRKGVNRRGVERRKGREEKGSEGERRRWRAQEGM